MAPSKVGQVSYDNLTVVRYETKTMASQGTAGNSMSREATDPYYPNVDTRLQRAVLSTFHEIVRADTTPDGRQWFPERILDELWNLWEERPGSIDYNRFRDDHKRAIEGIRNGRTRYRTNSPLLFALIERFVTKFAKPHQHVLPAETRTMIYELAALLFQFGFGNRFFGISPIGELISDDAIKWPVRVSLYELDMRYPSLTKPQHLFLAISPVAPKDHNFWPTVLFQKDRGYCELGLFIPEFGIAMTRPILGGYFEYDKKMYMPERMHVVPSNFRILNLDKIEVSNSGSIPEFDQKNFSYSEYAPAIRLIRSSSREVFRQAVGYLKLLDVPGESNYA